MIVQILTVQSVFFLKNIFEITKTVQDNSCVLFPQLSSMMTSYITIVHYQNQEIDIGVILNLQTLFEFHQFLDALIFSP